MSDLALLRGKLFAACWRGELDAVKNVLQTGQVDVNCLDDDGVSALRFAAQYGHLDVVEYLLDKGADVNRRAKDQLNPLLAAVEAGHLDIVRILLQNGAHAKVRTSQTNAVRIASLKGHSDIEQLLRTYGATEEMGLWFNVRHRFRWCCLEKA